MNLFRRMSMHTGGVSEKTRNIPGAPPVITSLPENSKRPEWSVMIPVYNSFSYLRETLENILEQAFDPDQMQIEVVDDVSTDGNVEELVRQVGKGRISYYRQAKNVGSVRNFETCMNRAQGKLVHIHHGDDKLRTGYYESIGKLFNKYPNAGAAFCRFVHINAEGKEIHRQRAENKEPGLLQNWLTDIAKHNRLQVVAITVKREVYEKLGGFYGISYGEDWEMWVRIARHYPVAYTPEILAEFRKHSQSLSGYKIRSGEYVHDLIQAIKMIQDHVPPHQKKEVLTYSNRYYAHYAVGIAENMWRLSHDRTGVKRNVKNALKLHRGWLMYFRAARLYVKMLLNR